MPAGLTRQQKTSLVAAWLGWAFDGLDGLLYVMVAIPFVTELVAHEHGVTLEVAKATLRGEITWKAATIQGFFLIGWAVGGAVFGRIGDRLGRSRTLTLTILTYAIFTGMGFFATEWWHLLIFRFLAALGIGGEWAAGSALVAETLHPKHRAWASALLQTGYQVGCIMAALTAGWLAGFGPRWVFVVGVTPALLTLWIRRAVPEPEEWTAAVKHQKPPPLRAIFSRELWKTTVLAVCLTSIALTTVWAFIYFSAEMIRSMPALRDWEPAARQQLVTSVTIAYLLVNIAGNFFATYLARHVGYRWAFGIMFAASGVVFLTLFRHEPTLKSVYWVVGAAAFTSLGVFGMFPLYIPPLFPTLVRTLGAGFTYNAGRLISGVGAFFGGWLTTHAGGPHAAIWWTGLLFIPGVVVACFIPRPRYSIDN